MYGGMTMKKRIVSLTVILTMVIAIMPAFNLTASAEGFTGSGGTGEVSSPYLISKEDDLIEFREYINSGENEGGAGKYFKLTGNIALSQQWEPIGIFHYDAGVNENYQFKGIFNGDNHTISGIVINDDTGMFHGLFGYIGVNAVVKNLGVDGNIVVDNNVGAVAGSNSGTIENCHSSATVSGTAEVGGIVGFNNNEGTIKNCYNTGDVSGNDNDTVENVGGIAGDNVGTIENCCNTGNITISSESGSSIGGVVGSNEQSGTIKKCCNAGTLVSPQSGGIAGTSDASKITNCYFINTADKGIGSNSGGVDGTNSKDENAFKSGEVAYLLQQEQETLVWTQALGADNCPLPTAEESKKVSKVTFMKGSEQYTVMYANPAGIKSLPAEPDASGSLVFGKWSQTNDAAGEAFTTETRVEKDMTVYAAMRESFGGDSDGAALTATYGYDAALTTDLDKLMAYKNEDLNENGRFTYTVNEPNSTSAKIEGSTLSVPTCLNAGEYTITITAKETSPTYQLMSVTDFGKDDVTLTVKVNIAQADAKVSTAPAANDLTYTGVAQTLVTAGKTEDGTLQYSTTETGIYSSDIPKGTDAQDYEVWYKVKGDDNHKDSAPQKVDVTIKKATPSVKNKPAAKDLTYTGEAQELVTAGETDDGELQYSLENDIYSPDIPKGTNADTYTVWYKVKGDANHNDGEPQQVQVTIKKAESSVTVKPKDLTYTGEAQELVTGETADGILKYAAEEEGDYEEAVPKGTNADTYTVWYKVVGDSNHNDSEPQSVDVTIKKVNSTLAVDGGEVTYGSAITLTASVTRDNTNGIRLAAIDTVEFYLGETPLGTGTVTYGSPLNDSGTATLEITADKHFEIGANTIRAEYGGSVNLNGSQNNSITVTMTKKPLEYSVTADGKVYDKNTSVNVTLTPTNNGEDDVTLTAKGAVLSADVGSYGKVDLTEIAIDGDDAKYYSVETEKSGADLTADIEITRAEGVAAVTMSDYKCGDETVQPVPSSDTNGTENVTYSYAAQGTDEYTDKKPLLAGEYTVKAVFDASANYNAVTVTDDFEVSHSWGEWKITDEPTQTTGGMAERDCLSEDNTASDTHELPNLTDASVWTKGKYIPSTPDNEGSQEYMSEYGTVTEILPKAVVNEIRISHAPNNTTVTEGMPVDISGLEVEAVYSDGSVRNVTAECKFTYDTTRTGEQQVTVEYGSKTQSFGITVKAKSVTGISISKKPNKRVYSMGDSLDMSGMALVVSYDNGTAAEITSGYDISGYDAQTAGIQTITVSYSGFTAEFTVTVEKADEPSETLQPPTIKTNGFYGGKTVTLTALSGASIRYTTDGSVPTSNSTLYSAPFEVTETTVVKAIAVKDGMENSKAAIGNIEIEKAAAPTADTASGEVDAGTLITLRNATEGADIFYTTDETVPTAESTRYNGSIAITDSVTIKAIAVKKGYAASDVCEVSYTVKAQTPKTAYLSVGKADGKTGGTVYVPVYIAADGDISDYSFTLTYDNTKFEYESIIPPEGSDASEIITSLGEKTVTVIYNGENALKSGEVCRVGFKTLAAATDGEYAVTVSDALVTVGGEYNHVTTKDGAVTLVTPEMQIPTDAVFTDADGSEVDKDEIKGEVNARITVDEAENAAEDVSMTANIILAVYDRSGALAAMSVMEADLSDSGYVFQRTIDIPENVTVGSIKLMIWRGLFDMSPLTAASRMI